jgi:hypothetical protein
VTARVAASAGRGPRRKPCAGAKTLRRAALVALAGSFCLAGTAGAATSTYLADGTAGDATSQHPGTWVGTPAYTQGDTADPSDLAFSFDGTQRIVMDGEVGRVRRDDVTISFAFKTTSPVHQSLVGKRDICDNPGEGSWEVRSGPNDPGVHFGAHPYGTSAVDRVVNDGAWHHVVVRRTAIALGFTVDGYTHVTPLMASDVNNPAAPLAISGSACIGIDGTHPFVGAIDDLVITQGGDCASRQPSEYDVMGLTSGGESPSGSFAPAAWLVIGLGAALTTGIAAAHRRRRWRLTWPASQTG